MARELNKEIFPTENKPKENINKNSSPVVADSIVEDLLGQMTAFKRQLRDLTVQLESTQNRLAEVNRQNQAGMERAQAAFTRLDQFVKDALQDIGSKYSVLTGRITERKMSDTKVEELLDRHNQLVHSFEGRLVQMQKLISEQEMKLMGYKSRLDEAKNSQPAPKTTPPSSGKDLYKSPYR